MGNSRALKHHRDLLVHHWGPDAEILSNRYIYLLSSKLEMGLCNGHWIFGQPTATFAFSRLSKIGGLQHLGFFYSDCQAHSWAFSYRLHYAFHLPTMIRVNEGNTKSLP